MRPIGNETGAAMSSTAVSLRHDHDVASPRCSSAGAPGEGGNNLRPVSRRLLEYWQVMLPLPLAARRRALDAACTRSRRDAVPDVLSFALGDTDEEIVYRATLAHVGAYPPHEAGAAAAGDAIDWVRRRLALNCTAVFAALLSLGDERLLDDLLPLRSSLGADEFGAIRRRLGAACPESARSFLQDWADLLDQSAARR